MPKGIVVVFSSLFFKEIAKMAREATKVSLTATVLETVYSDHIPYYLFSDNLSRNRIKF